MQQCRDGQTLARRRLRGESSGASPCASPSRNNALIIARGMRHGETDFSETFIPTLYAEEALSALVVPLFFSTARRFRSYYCWADSEISDCVSFTRAAISCLLLHIAMAVIMFCRLRFLF